MRVRFLAAFPAFALAACLLATAGGCGGTAAGPDPADVQKPGGDPPPPPADPAPAPAPDPDPAPGPAPAPDPKPAPFDFAGSWTLLAEVTFNATDPGMVGEVKTIPCEFSQAKGVLEGTCDLPDQRVSSTGSASGSSFSITFRPDAKRSYRAEGRAVGADGAAGKLTGYALGALVFKATFTATR